jgi:hypothetical protein
VGTPAAGCRPQGPPKTCTCRAPGDAPQPSDTTCDIFILHSAHNACNMTLPFTLVDKGRPVGISALPARLA